MLLFVLPVLTARLCGQHTPVIPESIEQFIEGNSPPLLPLPVSTQQVVSSSCCSTGWLCSPLGCAGNTHLLYQRVLNNLQRKKVPVSSPSRQQVVSLSRSSCVLPVKLSDGRGQGRSQITKSYVDAEKAWSSINHSILSDLRGISAIAHYRCVQH